MPTFAQRIRSGWNAFIGRDPTETRKLIEEIGYGYGSRPDRVRYRTGNLRNIVASVYNRIAVDVASIEFEHARLDEEDHYRETIYSSLNECLTVEANVDQTGRELIQDICESMFDEGYIAVVPTDTNKDPFTNETVDILELRTGKIVEWYPMAVKVHVYNENRGIYQDIIVQKKQALILTNPFYSIMNEPNSTAQRLIAAINKLNTSNDIATSKKLDLIIQLPYVTRSDQRREEAKRRKKDIEDQLENSPLGIAYTDATEKVTQLNRSLENNLWTQVKELTEQLFSQLGVTPSILDGTADEATRINYFNSTIAPICQALVDEMNRKFLSKTARTQKQRVIFFRDPFKLVPVSQLAEIADKFRRNEIMTSNELRAEIGMRPNDSNKADDISNPNLNKSTEELKADGELSGNVESETGDTSGKSVDTLLQSLGKQSIK
jgi:hypothetical protein